MSGIKGALGVAVGLAVAQLVLSTSERGGSGSKRLAAGYQLPGQWLRDLIDPSKPGIPQTTKGLVILPWWDTGSNPTQSSLQSGLSGVGTPTGTGSSTLPAGIHQT